MELPRYPAPRLVRYAKYRGNNPREVVLLKGLPCVWSRCSFCDYIDDNTRDTAEIRRVADDELAKVTGEFGRLQVINSGSIQELPIDVQSRIRELLARRGIRDFWTESYWAYRKDYEATRRFFGVETHLFLGVETFDDALRNDVLNKSMHWKSPDEVAQATDSICLLIGFRGQTRDIIRRDIDLLLGKFRYGIVNLFTENRLSDGLLDRDIQAWFREEYAWLEQQPNVDVLWNNTDFGVG
ncbi:MAG: radical SAM protein [Planctomycetota bacterium]|nr:MAG: radical SAM protein [Planctomycetota bacterium]